MARIVFFVEDLPHQQKAYADFAWPLIRSLADQHHEIRVLTTYRPGVDLPKLHPRIEILSPFSNWSWREVYRVLPLLLGFRPDVLHFIQPRFDLQNTWTHAARWLTPLRHMLSGPRIVLSLYDIDRRAIDQLGFLIRESDALTVMNPGQKQLLLNRFGPELKIELMAANLEALPSSEILVSNVNGHATPSSTEIFQRLYDKQSVFLFIPGPLDQHLDFDASFELVSKVDQHLSRLGQKAWYLFSGGWGDTPHRQRDLIRRQLVSLPMDGQVVFAGPQPEAEELIWMQRAQAVWLSPLDPARLAFVRALRVAQAAGASLILSPDQVQQDPIGWQDGTNVFVRGIGHDVAPNTCFELLVQVLTDQNLAASVRRPAQELYRRAVLDQPSNSLSRLYKNLL